MRRRQGGKKKQRTNFKQQSPAISVALIARNEESHLERAISSVQPFASEVVVVDTGSTDDTAAIARRLGARVYPFRWSHSFSKARNYSFDRCRGHYIWWMDPDEEVPVACVENILGLLKTVTSPDEVTVDTFLNGTYRPTEENLPGYGPGFAVAKPRMIRNQSGIRWRHSIHEELVSAGPVSHLQVPRDKIHVLNHGNANDTDGDYYKALMVLGHRDYPDEPHYTLHLVEWALVEDFNSQRALDLLSGLDPDKLQGEQLGKFWLHVGQAQKMRAIFAHDRGDVDAMVACAEKAVIAYGNVNRDGETGAALDCATMMLYLGEVDSFQRIVMEVRKQTPGGLLAQYFERFLEAKHPPDTLVKKVGRFLGALRTGQVGMEEVYQTIEAEGENG